MIENKANGPNKPKVCVYRALENITAIECTAKGKDTNSVAIGLFGSEKPDLVEMAKDSPNAKRFFKSSGDSADLPADGARVESDGKKKAYSALGRKLSLQPGESKTVSFAMSWRYPLVRYGTGFGNSKKAKTLGQNHYATLFPTAADASNQIADREEELYGETKKWTETWYDSTLPYWFLERCFMTVNTMQTQTAQRVIPPDGKQDIYNLEEGVRCCPGNCTHVWYYAQGLSRIFPVIERECRDRIEFGIGQNKESGAIAHRYMGGKFKDAIDGTCGAILRVLRESQMTNGLQFPGEHLGSDKALDGSRDQKVGSGRGRHVGRCSAQHARRTVVWSGALVNQRLPRESQGRGSDG